ncbi:MAG: hypothetical protein HY699_06290 [Deltaproteobacteria bacterium]|nr:hypothetical protein [Deltaproteobacteria bacterium]
MDKVLGHFDAPAIRALLDEAGVLAALAERGFGGLDVDIESGGRALPHIVVWGEKIGQRCVLLDACVGEAVVRPSFFARAGYQMERPMELAVVHWVREEDPTAAFVPDRPPLPLQRHPGLGVLRRAFRVLVRMANDLHKDGVANVPKFFHDAVIFLHSRMFLFLDGGEQGRFEALQRDLRPLALGDASVALAGRCVRDGFGGLVEWMPGYQVFPLSAPLTAYFHSGRYAAEVAEALHAERFSYDGVAVARICAALRAPPAALVA